MSEVAAGGRLTACIDDHAALPQQIGRKLVLGRAVGPNADNERSGVDIGKREHRVCRRGHGDDDIRAARRGTGACCSFTLEPSAVTRRPNSSAASSRGSRYWTRPIVATSRSASR